MSIQSSISRACVRGSRAFFLVLLGLQLAACVTPEASRTQTSEGPVSPKPDQETARLQEGMDHFRRADYQQALVLFEELSRSAQSEPVRRKALYAQGCTRLIMAQSAEEYSGALALWQSWSRLAPPGTDEDPRMLSPILERISPMISTETKGTSSAQASKPKKKSGSRTIYINKDLAAHKNMMDTKEKEFERVKTRLESKEREVKRLKQQIESLEAIHLKFQERQKETSTP
jgi:hypothetical protein